MSTNYGAWIIEQPSSLRPVVPTGLRAGTIWLETDTNNAYIVKQGATPSSSPTWVSFAAPAPVDLYINTATGSDANPGTITKPVKTGDGLFARLPSSYTGHCRMHDITPGGGTIAFNSGVTNAPQIYFTPEGVGQILEPPCIIGVAPVDTGLGPQVVASTTTTALPGIGTSTILHFAGTPFVAHALQNLQLNCTASATPGDIGNASPIIDNTNNSITLLGNYTGAISGGDTIIIYQPGTTLVGHTNDVTGFFGRLLLICCSWRTVGTGGPDLECTGGELGFFSCDIQPFDGVTHGRIRASGGATLTFNNQASLLDNLIVPPSALPVGMPFFAGNVIRNGQAGVGGVFCIKNSTLSAGSLICTTTIALSNCSAVFQLCWFPIVTGGVPAITADGVGALGLGDAGPVGLDFVDCAVTSAHDCIDCLGAVFGCNSLDLSGNNGLIARQTKGLITGLTGTNTLTGLQCSSASSFSVTDANTGTTISGGAATVVVGGNTTTTWLLILGGLTAHVSDVGAASTQLCYVGV